MIMTQYGTPIDRVVHVDEKYGMATVEMVDAKGKKVRREYFLNQLRADDGIREIIGAAESHKS